MTPGDAGRLSTAIIIVGALCVWAAFWFAAFLEEATNIADEQRAEDMAEQAETVRMLVRIECANKEDWTHWV